MLVVDRREEEGAYDPGENRAKVQEALEKHHFQIHGILESTALPARVEIEQAPVPERPLGIPVLTTTPGPDALLRLLAERIWGVTTI